MNQQFGFEKLEVWKLARKLAGMIYKVTVAFPDFEKFSLANQMRRASVSVASNIAEGCGRSGLREQMRFIEIAYGSLIEIVNQLFIAKDLDYIQESQYADILEMSHHVAAMLSSFRNSLLSRLSK